MTARRPGSSDRDKPSRRVALLGATGLLLAGCGARDGTRQRARVYGSVMPPADRGEPITLSGPALGGGPDLITTTWRGAPVVVNVWGSWCAPCRKEAPDLQRVATETAPLGVRFLGINVRDNDPAAIAFEKAFRIPYPSIADPDQLVLFQFDSYIPPAVPTTHILDAQGRVAAQFVGPVTYPDLLNNVRIVLTETNPELASVRPTPDSS